MFIMLILFMFTVFICIRIIIVIVYILSEVVGLGVLWLFGVVDFTKAWDVPSIPSQSPKTFQNLCIFHFHYFDFIKWHWWWLLNICTYCNEMIYTLYNMFWSKDWKKYKKLAQCFVFGRKQQIVNIKHLMIAIIITT